MGVIESQQRKLLRIEFGLLRRLLMSAAVGTLDGSDASALDADGMSAVRKAVSVDQRALVDKILTSIYG